MGWTQKLIAGGSSLSRLAPRTLQRQCQRCLWTCMTKTENKYFIPKPTQVGVGSRTLYATEWAAIGKEVPGALVAELEPDKNGRTLRVKWADNSVSKYNASWLRHNCHCDKCKQPHSGQKMVSIMDFPSQLTIHSTAVQDNSRSVSVSYVEEPDHQCVFPTAWLKHHSYSQADLEHNSRLRDIKFLQGAIGTFRWEDVKNSEDTLFEWLDHLNTYGITLMKKVPVSPESVTKVANLVGPIIETLYGLTFDVIAERNPINVAYSTVSLGFHVDLAYYESPPGLQLLHCLQFDDVVMGGESIFLDSFSVAQDFRETNPHHFEVLTRIPATFQKFHFERAYPAAYVYQRPHINVNREGQIIAVTWAPAFEGPLAVPEEDVEPYYEAYRAFCHHLETSEKRVSYRLQQGDCIIFNNRRVLHGRTQFQQNGGARHLKGCYVNIDDFRSKIQYLHEKRKTGQFAKRVGNQCMF